MKPNAEVSSKSVDPFWHPILDQLAFETLEHTDVQTIVNTVISAGKFNFETTDRYFSFFYLYIDVVPD